MKDPDIGWQSTFMTLAQERENSIRRLWLPVVGQVVTGTLLPLTERLTLSMTILVLDCLSCELRGL